MELHTIRGGDKVALEEKRYNLGVGVSLGNRWFTTENIIGLIRWSLRYTREDVLVHIVDTIHAINIEVRRHGTSKARALLRAKRMGQEMLEDVRREAEKNFSPQEQSRIIYAMWDDITDENYRKKVEYLYDLYDSNSEFKSCIRSIMQKRVLKEGRVFDEKEIEYLGTYLLEELPEVIARVPIKGVVFDALVYPFDGEVMQLVDKIQQDMLFPEIKKNILDTEPKVFLEVR